MKRKQVFCVFGALFLAGSLLAGCGQEEASSSAASSQAGSSSPTTSSGASSSQVTQKDANLVLATPAGGLDKVYDGEAADNPEYTTDSDGAVTFEWKEGDAALDAAPSDAGSYTVSVKVAATELYYSDEASMDVVISKADIDVSGLSVSGTEAVYDGTAKEIALGALPDGISEATVAYSQDGTAVEAPIDAGTYQYTITFAVADPDNHNVPDPLVGSLVIEKAEGETPTLPDGYATTVDYTGEEFALPEAADGVTYAWKGAAAKDAGDYVIVATRAGDANHNDATAEYAFHVNKAEISLTGVSFADAMVPFDNASHTIEATGFDSTKVAVSYTKDGVEFTGATDAGAYEITATFTPLDAANYEISGEATRTATLTITKIAGAIALTDTSKTYDGQPVSAPTATVTEGAAAATGTWLASDQTTVLDEAPREPGTYYYKASSADNGNVAASEATQQIVISPFKTSVFKGYDDNEVTLAHNASSGDAIGIKALDDGGIEVTGWWIDIMPTGITLDNVAGLRIKLKLADGVTDTGAITINVVDGSGAAIAYSETLIATAPTEYQEYYLPFSQFGDGTFGRVDLLAEGRTFDIAYIELVKSPMLFDGEVGYFAKTSGYGEYAVFPGENENEISITGHGWGGISLNRGAGKTISKNTLYWSFDMRCTDGSCAQVMIGLATPSNALFTDSGYATPVLTAEWQTFTYQLPAFTEDQNFGHFQLNPQDSSSADLTTDATFEMRNVRFFTEAEGGDTATTTIAGASLTLTGVAFGSASAPLGDASTDVRVGSASGSGIVVGGGSWWGAVKFDTPLTAEGMTKAVIVLRRLGDASASRDTQIILADSNNTVVGSNVSITFDTTAPMSSAVTVTIDLTDGWTDIAGFACIVAGDSTNNYWNALYIESITFAA